MISLRLPRAAWPIPSLGVQAALIAAALRFAWIVTDAYRAVVPKTLVAQLDP
ncbi:hypothetical protein [Kutzneria kofuensis]|uniref:Uncharacterized protein n=1 Tax=Kutzneria kofuensis TaxID=103725 RepID=A0A7W9NJP9_9PSEU|nr:hypothetical protein [Kutzneria kofuensis]MBB5894383.1 hypothetical protein [Kutzneria kofuensis]